MFSQTLVTRTTKMIRSSVGNKSNDLHNPRTPLRDAVDTGDVKKVRAALKKGGLDDIEYWREALMKSVKWSVEDGRPEILDALIEAGANGPAADKWLSIVAEFGVVDLMGRLLAAGVSENGRGAALVRTTEWMRDCENTDWLVAPEAHADCVRMLLEAGTTAAAKDWALKKAATYGDAWMVGMLLEAGVGEEAITAAVSQAEKHKEAAVLAVLTQRLEGGVDVQPVRRAAIFDVYFVADDAAHAALLDEITPAYAAAIEKRPDAEQLIAGARLAGQKVAASQMLDVKVGDGVAAGEIEKRWRALGGGGKVVLLGARSMWEAGEAAAWRDAIAMGKWRSLIA
jgi:hypothetical protein